MKDSIFTKIIKGEIPSHKIYEDDKTLAFLDIFPVQPGMTIVVPKQQVEFVWDLDDDNYDALMASVKKVAMRLRTVMSTTYVGEIIEGVEVPHAHVKLIPFDTIAEFRAPQDTSSEPAHSELAALAAQLAF